MTDDEGNIHELGTNTFGLISTQSEKKLENWFRGLPKVQPAKILKSPSRPGRNGIATEINGFWAIISSVVCVRLVFLHRILALTL